MKPPYKPLTPLDRSIALTVMEHHTVEIPLNSKEDSAKASSMILEALCDGRVQGLSETGVRGTLDQMCCLVGQLLSDDALTPTELAKMCRAVMPAGLLAIVDADESTLPGTFQSMPLEQAMHNVGSWLAIGFHWALLTPEEKTMWGNPDDYHLVVRAAIHSLTNPSED